MKFGDLKGLGPAVVMDPNDLWQRINDWPEEDVKRMLSVGNVLSQMALSELDWRRNHAEYDALGVEGHERLETWE